MKVYLYMQLFYYLVPEKMLNAETQLTFTCSKSTIEKLEKGVRYVLS